MIRKLAAGALALAGLLSCGVASAQLAGDQPIMWYGVIVPTAGNCTVSQALAWPAVFRPYLAGQLTNTQPSSIIVMTANGRAVQALRNGNATNQFRGSGTYAGVVAMFKNARMGPLFSDDAHPGQFLDGTFNFTVTTSSANDKIIPTTKWIKIEGTITKPNDNDSVAEEIFCATSIRGVFTLQPTPVQN
jgi:hypothetical protein